MNSLIIDPGPKQLSNSFLEMKFSEANKSTQVQEQSGNGLCN